MGPSGSSAAFQGDLPITFRPREMSPRPLSRPRSQPRIAPAVRLAAQTPASLRGPWPDISEVPWTDPGTEDMAREVAAREVELRALRGEVDAKEVEAQQLRERLQDVDVKLLSASGAVDMLSAKVEATAGNRHAMLEASARQLDGHVATLRRRLAQMEWDLAEKDEEVVVLQAAAREDVARCMHQREQLDRLRDNQQAQNMQVAQLAGHTNVLQRHRAIDDWRSRVQAQIHEEHAIVGARNEWQVKEEEIKRLTADNQRLQEFVRGMEAKIQQHRNELEMTKKHHDALLMEERLCVSAMQLGNETAEEQKRALIEENRSLEARLKQEQAHAQSRAPVAAAYDHSEAEGFKYEEDLSSLTECMREISRALREPGGVDDAVDAAMSEFLRSSRDIGVSLPPCARVGPCEYLIGNELLQCTVIDGRLFVRPNANDNFAPIGEHMVHRGAGTLGGPLASPGVPVGQNRPRNSPVSQSRGVADPAGHWVQNQPVSPRQGLEQPLANVGPSASALQGLMPAQPASPLIGRRPPAIMSPIAGTSWGPAFPSNQVPTAIQV